MKRQLFGVCVAASVFTAGAADAGIILTGIIDGGGSSPKGVEVYVDSTADYTGWALGTQSNASTSAPSIGYTFSGTLTEGFYYITSTDTDMISTFASATASNTIADSSFNQNGDDRFYVFDDSSDLIDQFGVDGVDGTGEAWEYTDSYAYRTDNTGPDGGFALANWTFGGINLLDTLPDSTAPFGTYVPEPASLALVGLGGLAMLGRGWRQN